MSFLLPDPSVTLSLTPPSRPAAVRTPPTISLRHWFRRCCSEQSRMVSPSHLNRTCTELTLPRASFRSVDRWNPDTEPSGRHDHPSRCVSAEADLHEELSMLILGSSPSSRRPLARSFQPRHRSPSVHRRVPFARDGRPGDRVLGDWASVDAVVSVSDRPVHRRPRQPLEAAAWR